MICCSGHETEEIVSDAIHALEDQGEYINPEQLEMDYPDPKDAVFYEVVMEKRKSDDAYLVTGNIKHFPEKHFVVTPREMLDIFFFLVYACWFATKGKCVQKDDATEVIEKIRNADLATWRICRRKSFERYCNSSIFRYQFS